MSAQIKGTGNSVLGGADLGTPLAQASGGTGGNYPVYQMVLGTAQATTSGTSIDFTGIPSWVKRITVMLNGVSTNGSSLLMVQVGAGSITASGYLSNAWSNNINVATTTIGFILAGLNSSTGQYSGHVVLTPINVTTVIESSILGSDVANNAHTSGGKVTLAGALDRIRLTTINGTDTFDAGSVNIMYEGYA